MGTDGQMSFESNELPIFIYVGLVMQIFTETLGHNLHLFIYLFYKNNILKAFLCISIVLMFFTEILPTSITSQLVPLQYSPGTLCMRNKALSET